MYTEIETLKNVIANYDEEHDYYKDLCKILKFVEDNQMRKIWSWSKLDVATEVESRNKELSADEQIKFTDELADAVLDQMEKDGDAGIGISWDDVSNALDKILKK